MNERKCDVLNGSNHEIIAVRNYEHSQNLPVVIDVKVEENCAFSHMDNGIKNTMETSEDVRKETNIRMPFGCTECGEYFSNEKKLLKHRTKHLGVKPFNCNECSKGYTYFGDLKRHRTMHLQVKPFNCNDCTRGFGYICALRRHIKNVHMNKRFNCNECSLAFRSKESLKKHTHVHVGYIYTECGHDGKSKSNLKNHILNNHKPEEKRFACTECDYKTDGACKLRYHIKRHRGDKPFICDICGKQFESLCTLQDHILIHENKKPFDCTICNKAFRTKKNLKSHMFSHTKEKLYFCAQCNFGSVTKPGVKFHMKTVHSNERPFECPACGNSYKTKGNLTKHQNGSRGVCHALVSPLPGEQS